MDTTRSADRGDRRSSPLVDVLRTRHSGYLLVTSLAGRLPSAMAALAIVQLVRSTSGDFGLAGLVTAVYVIAGAVAWPCVRSQSFRSSV